MALPLWGLLVSLSRLAPLNSPLFIITPTVFRSKNGLFNMSTGFSPFDMHLCQKNLCSNSKLYPTGIKATGYFSYLRGENPITFPYRLYPINRDRILKNDKLDIFGNKVKPCNIRRFQRFLKTGMWKEFTKQ